MNVKNAAASFALTGIVIAGATAAAQSRQQRPTPVPPPAKAPSVPKDHVDIKGEVYSDRKTPSGNILTFAGGARFQSEDSILVTNLATYNKTTFVASAPGKLQLDDAQNTIIGDRGVAYYKPKDAKITGNVHINVRPKPGDANAPEGSLRREFKQPATITCDNVDYNWRDKVAVLTGHLTMKYEDRTITAEKAVYYGNEERVDLSGNVRYNRANGDKGVADAATVVMKEGQELFYIPKGTHPFSITFEVPKDEDQNNSDTGGAAKAPAVPKTAPPLPPELTGGGVGPAATPPVTAPPPPAAGGAAPAGSGTGTAPAGGGGNGGTPKP